MKSKPVVMEHFSTVHTSFVVDFTFTNNITILMGDSGTGKTATFSFIRECMAVNPRILCLDNYDYQKDIKEITIIPLMVVAGDHAKNDMASDEEDSWKSRFESEGIKANVILKGLGEYEEFGNLYIDRINDVINGTYKGLGETKKKKHRREMK